MSEFPIQADVAGGVNVRIAGLEAIVHQDAFAPVVLHACSLQVEPIDVRGPAGSDQDLIHGERLLFSLCLIADKFPSAIALDPSDRRIQAQRYPLTDEGPLHERGCLHVLTVEQVRIFVINDIDRRDPVALASAYRELFLASGGGALGLFTSVRNLRAVEERIAVPVAEAGLTLYAQHVDRLDAGTLVDLFRAEENACVLGTDALRDGVDVPGRSLRLVVFDKVPWPRPTILHKARREHFGRGYDDLLTRLRLKQAFGRLIRSQADKGCFVILEPATPTRRGSARTRRPRPTGTARRAEARAGCSAESPGPVRPGPGT